MLLRSIAGRANVKVSTLMSGSRWVSATTVVTVRLVVRSTAAVIAGGKPRGTQLQMTFAVSGAT